MNKQILKNAVFVGLFLVPFVPFLVSSSFFFPYITSKAFAWRIIVEIVFFAWLILALIDVDYRPKRSPLLYAVLAFITVIGLADLFGAAPGKSFWSNFERMEGFITLLHLGAFFLVTSSVFKELDWKRWWNTSLAASAFMIVYCLFQVAGVLTIQQGGVRVDGTFGNAIYLAVYMLFHVFIALFYMLRSWKNSGLRFIYSLLVIFQLLILYFTATRGAILGFMGGLIILALLNLRNKAEPALRRLSITLIALLVLVVGGFWMVKDSSFVMNSPVLSRFATLDLADIKTQGRYFVWPMAWEGFKDRPLLGWGQENFSYVFQEHYSPEMYALEPWFDRAHNIFLDWMVAGGLIGLLTYLSLYVLALYFIWRKENFSTTERSVLTALIAAYFFHNLFVFDHLISYILFFSLLAHLHSRSAAEPLWRGEMKKAQTLALPVAALLLIGVFYFGNWKPIKGNLALIEALQAMQTSNYSVAALAFPKAYSTSPLGRTEILEQSATHSVNILGSGIPVEERNTFFSFMNEAINQSKLTLGEDARYNLVVGSFLSSVGNLDEAQTYLEKAKMLMPGKPEIQFELGALHINKNDRSTALTIFREAYQLEPRNTEARILYLVGAIYGGDRVAEAEMMGLLSERTFVFDDRIVSAYYNNGRMERVIEIILARKQLDPDNAATYDEYLKQLGN